MLEKMIIQHPSTPEEMGKPQSMAEQCMADFFPQVIATIADWGFDVEEQEFHDDFRLIVEFTRALLFKQVGLHHDLQIALGENNILNRDEKE